MAQSVLTIGRLASEAGVSVETVRYYQRLGLITEPEKPREGYRVYPSDTITRLLFIKRAQQLGFTLGEIGELLDMSQGCCDDMRSRAEEKRDQVNAQIRDLSALRDTLDSLIDSCNAGSSSVSCPIIDSLTQPGSKED